MSAIEIIAIPESTSISSISAIFGVLVRKRSVRAGTYGFRLEAIRVCREWKAANFQSDPLVTWRFGWDIGGGKVRETSRREKASRDGGRQAFQSDRRDPEFHSDSSPEELT